MLSDIKITVNGRGISPLPFLRLYGTIFIHSLCRFFLYCREYAGKLLKKVGNSRFKREKNPLRKNTPTATGGMDMSIWKKLREAWAQTPKNLGKQGETAVARKLRWADFWGYRGRLLRNVYVPTSSGGTTEIDLLYLTRKGLFVIESKNYTGYLFGSDWQQNWTETFRGRKTWLGRRKVEKHPFYNPIWQNEAHISRLRAYLENEIPMFSVIVFSDHCVLKEIDYDPEEVTICQQRELFRKLRTIWRRHPNCLRDADIVALYEELRPLTKVDHRTKRQHVRDVRTQRRRVPTCPWCGGTLVLRTARSGPHAGEPFYGCSNYPRCQYLRDRG